MKVIVSVVIGVLAVVGIWNFIVGGWHYELGQGQHTGYITAVVRSGIFWKTDTVYVKTDTQSSQEDDYCVIDPAVYAQLATLSQQKAHVTVSFTHYIMTGLSECGVSNEVITSVQVDQ